MTSSFCSPTTFKNSSTRSLTRSPLRVAKCSIQAPEGAKILNVNLSPRSIEDKLENLQFGYERMNFGECPAAPHGSIRYRCRNGHIVTTALGSPSCRICPSCVFSECTSKRLCIKKLSATARERGGELLSTVYLNSKQKLLWRCSKGHVWAATASNIRSRKSWCPTCGNSHDIEHMQKLAQSRGGSCISKEYRGVNKKLRWRCKCGNEFDQTPNNAFRKPGGRRKSSWCPLCPTVD